MIGSTSESMMIASIASWFTPTVIFCVTNLIIATIFIASNNNKNKQHDQNSHGDSISRIARVSSFIDRARSINVSSYTTTTTTESLNHYSPKPKTADYTSSSRLAQSIYQTPPSQLTGTPSLLERVKSIKFTSESEPVNSPGQLERVPSFFDRVKSFKISTPFTTPENVGTDTDPSHNNSDHHVIRSKSEKKSKAINKLKSVDHQMKKSRSAMRLAKDDDEDVDLRRPATTRERRNNVVDEEVDAKADDFISRFKQQLKLQRLESLVRYNEKLNRRN